MTTKYTMDDITIFFALDTGRIIARTEVEKIPLFLILEPLQQSLEDLRDAYVSEGGDFEGFFLTYLPNLCNGHCKAFMFESSIAGIPPLDTGAKP